MTTAFVWDGDKYRYDRGGKSCEATLAEGAVLYRLVSETHCAKEDVLSGRGAGCGRHEGRFHQAHQATSYCSNNVLVCIAEMLYHMHRHALDSIERNDPRPHVRQHMSVKKGLMIVSIDPIDKLVYADSMDIVVHEPRIRGAGVVFPGPSYKFMRDLNNKLRSEGSNGVLYPSARHSKDMCVALFGDRSKNVRTCLGPFWLQLQLLHEEEDLDGSLATGRLPEPFEDKIHPTMGYFEFEKARAIDDLVSGGLLYPGIPAKGRMDFVRRRYSDYPAKAIVP